MIDGKIARHYNMISTVGKVLDPLADKVTQFTLTVCLAIKYPQLWIIAGLIFVKEIFQLVAMCVFLRKGKMLSGALMSGKVCTTVLFVSLILLVLIPNIGNIAVTIIAILDGIVLLIAFADYFLTYAKRTSKLKDIPN
jgi:cardiolipin synthase